MQAKHAACCVPADRAHIGDTIICHGEHATVTAVRRYAPGAAPAGAPVKAHLMAVEVVTPRGSRWHGVEDYARTCIAARHAHARPVEVVPMYRDGLCVTCWREREQ